MREILNEGLEQLGLTPPEGAVERLEIYARLLVEQNKVMNLTAITEPEAVARLHFLDSAAVLGYLRGAGHISGCGDALSVSFADSSPGGGVVGIGGGRFRFSTVFSC